MKYAAETTRPRITITLPLEWVIARAYGVPISFPSILFILPLDLSRAMLAEARCGRAFYPLQILSTSQDCSIYALVFYFLQKPIIVRCSTFVPVHSLMRSRSWSIAVPLQPSNLVRNDTSHCTIWMDEKTVVLPLDAPRRRLAAAVTAACPCSTF